VRPPLPPIVPRWVKRLGLASGLFVLGVYALLNFPVVETGAKTCGRCGAIESGPLVCGLWFGSEREDNPGQALVERLAGPCATHQYRATGCWNSFARVACTMQSTGDPAFEACALAGGPLADRLAARLLNRSHGDRHDVFWRALSKTHGDVDDTEAARRWVMAVIETEGWHDLEGQ